jgi:integrative and conjugative element protein (TIGR02256 family)
MTVWLSTDVAARIGELAELYYPLETGGVLLGWRDGHHRIVAGLIGPGPTALHGRRGFFPDHAWQKSEISKAFAGSSGDLDYLGDWHTHPDGIAAMSAVDRQTLARIARRVSRPLMVISAGRPTSWNADGWSLERGGLFTRTEPEPETLRHVEAPANWPTFYSAF